VNKFMSFFRTLCFPPCSCRLLRRRVSRPLDQPARLNKKRWSAGEITPEEKQELRERFQRWKSLSPEDKADLQKRYNNWRRLSPDEKATVRKTTSVATPLPRSARTVAAALAKWRDLPPERRRYKERLSLPRLPRETARAQREFQERFRTSPRRKQQLRESSANVPSAFHRSRNSNCEKLERLSPEEKKLCGNSSRTSSTRQIETRTRP
jgi:hypothetical protein